jgi:hypothetical protein
MIFIHKLPEVLSGDKTLTSRLVRGAYLCVDTYGILGATDSPHFHEMGPLQTVSNEKGRLLYEVGKTYAIQPGRGKSGVGRLKIMRLRINDAREITQEEAREEGFDHAIDFLSVWAMMYDKAFFKQITPSMPAHGGTVAPAGRRDFQELIWMRPAAPYRRVAINFLRVR